MIVKDYTWSYSGHNISLSNPKPEDFDIDSMSIVLGRICRFGSQCKIFYSVAEHSIHISNLLAKNNYSYELQLHGLLDDGDEYILGDILTPVKYNPLVYKAFKPIQEKFMRAIAKRFGFRYNKKNRAIVKSLERQIEMAEIRDLMNISESERAKLDFSICKDIPDLSKNPMSAEQAAIMFRRTFDKIQRNLEKQNAKKN